MIESKKKSKIFRKVKPIKNGKEHELLRKPATPIKV